jgi:TonB family protein
MRAFGFSLIGLLAIVDLASSQVTDVPSSKKTDLPMFRPALLGTGPSSLVNRIDTQDLIKKGQKDAAIMFSCSVKKTGEVAWSGTYRGTPDSKLLDLEVRKRLSDAKFIPAVYNHIPVDAIYYGTVTFAVIEGRPRLRIFSNQQAEELIKESDFIAPQPFFGADSRFTGFHYPETAPVQLSGVALLEIKVDASGNPQELKVRSEEPPFLGFGDAAVTDFNKAKFIPAFRDGKPVACDVTVPVYYTEKGF